MLLPRIIPLLVYRELLEDGGDGCDDDDRPTDDCLRESLWEIYREMKLPVSEGGIGWTVVGWVAIWLPRWVLCGKRISNGEFWLRAKTKLWEPRVKLGRPGQSSRNCRQTSIMDRDDW